VCLKKHKKEGFYKFEGRRGEVMRRKKEVVS
jgi:hypothetical protein